MIEAQTESQKVDGRRRVREPIKEGEVQLRKGEYMGRNGAILKRTPAKAGNKYDLPDDIKEHGWDYQWVRHSLYNNTEFSELPTMKRAGWSEVHPEALKGYFREQGAEGQNCITMEDLILVERPLGMTLEARAEDLANANKHYHGQIHKIYDETAQLPSGYRTWKSETRVDHSEIEEAPMEWKPAHRPRKIDVED